jgi:GAF domain-containing protein
MASVHRFDERLDRLLERQASAAGETVLDYVSRAVAARILLEIAEQDEGHVDELREHMAKLGVSASSADSNPDFVRSKLNDPERLRALHRTGLLDSQRDDVYDRLTLMATHALGVPMAAVSLVDDHRQFFKSLAGVEGEIAIKRQTPIERSVCQYVVSSGEPLVVEDARVHPLLSNHPAVVDNSVIAYAGIPLNDYNGHTIGTLCVWDERPKQWTSGHVLTLVDLANLVRERIFGPER